MSTNEVQELKESVKKIEEMSVRMHTALIGDCEIGIEGLVQRVDKNENFRKTIQKGIWWSTGAIGVLGFLFYNFRDLFLKK